MTLERWLIALPLVLVVAHAQSYFWVGNELMAVKTLQEAQG